jgi:hypothetical protein
MASAGSGFKLETLERKKVEKVRKKERDARIHQRLSALLWLSEGRGFEEVAGLLDVCPRTVRNWLALYQSEGLEALCTLEYKGDKG